MKKMMKKSKGMARGGKTKGGAKGGAMTLASIRSAAKAKGYKLVKAQSWLDVDYTPTQLLRNAE